MAPPTPLQGQTVSSTAERDHEIASALRHLRSWEGDPRTYRAIMLALARLNDVENERDDALARIGQLTTQPALRAGDPVEVHDVAARHAGVVKNLGNATGPLVVVVAPADA